MAEKEPDKDLRDLILEGRLLAGRVLSESLGYGFIDGYGLIRLKTDKPTELTVDGIEYTTAPFEPGETPIRVTGHAGVVGEAGTMGTTGERGAWKSFETSNGIKRFRVRQGR